MADEKKPEKLKLTAFVVVEAEGSDGKPTRTYYSVNPTHFSVKAESTFNGFTNSVKRTLKLIGFADQMDREGFTAEMEEKRS
jgi:hypothetical protein